MIRIAGGWIFDRVMGGWVVDVSVPSCHDSRALQILGVTVQARSFKDLNRAALQVFLGQDVATAPELVEHRLSAAARVLKAHALSAARLSSRVDDHEHLWVTGLCERTVEHFDVCHNPAGLEFVAAQPVKASSSS